MTDEIITLPPEDVTPWEKLEAESAKAFAAFIIYRNLPARDRSLRRAAEEHYGEASSSKVRQFQRWSAQFMWVDRAGSWDEYKDAVDREAVLDAIKDMNENHIKIAKGLVSVAVQRLTAMKPEELSPETVLRYITEAARVERTAHGEPDTIIEQQQEEYEETYAEMTDEQLQQRIAKRRIQKSRNAKASK